MKQRMLRIIAAGLMLILAVAALPAVAEDDVGIDIESPLWVGQGYVYTYMGDLTDDAVFVSVRSSDPGVLKVKHDEGDLGFYVKPLKAGKCTLKYTYRLDGRRHTIKKAIRVKKYPNAIASLKVNGKAVSLKKNKFTYTVSKFKKRAVTITVKRAKGWKVKGMYADLEYIGYMEIKNGKTFRLDKEGRGTAWIDMVNSKNQVFRYTIEINRV